MSDEPTPPAPENSGNNDDKKKAKRARNDQRIAAEITAADRLLRTVRTDADIQPVATAFGIDEAELTAAAAAVQEAARRWGVRLEGMGTEDQLVEETDEELTAIRDAYLQYRQIGRANFADPAARLALGVSGDIPDGFNALVTHIRAAYTAAKTAPYTATFSKRGYPPAELDRLIQAVADLVDDEADQTEAEGDAMKKTRERNLAYQAMKDAVGPIKGTLQGALRKRPDLLAKLGK